DFGVSYGCFTKALSRCGIGRITPNPKLQEIFLVLPHWEVPSEARNLTEIITAKWRYGGASRQARSKNRD
ncbi:hypothetical protein HAX54_007277, partial [Datura stramonium]|nr:hypothetical protein [Datura stramonium]